MYVWLRHVLHVARRPGTIGKSLLGQLRPHGPLQHSFSGQAVLSTSQMVPRPTWPGQPYRAEAEPAEPAEPNSGAHGRGGHCSRVHRTSFKSESYHYQALIIRHRAHSDGASFIFRGMTRRGGSNERVYFCNAHLPRSVQGMRVSSRARTRGYGR